MFTLVVGAVILGGSIATWRFLKYSPRNKELERTKATKELEAIPAKLEAVSKATQEIKKLEEQFQEPLSNAKTLQEKAQRELTYDPWAASSAAYLARCQLDGLLSTADLARRALARAETVKQTLIKLSTDIKGLTAETNAESCKQSLNQAKDFYGFAMFDLDCGSWAYADSRLNQAQNSIAWIRQQVFIAKAKAELEDPKNELPANELPANPLPG